MIKTNTFARKILVFLVVFVSAGCLMGSQWANQTDAAMLFENMDEIVAQYHMDGVFVKTPAAAAVSSPYSSRDGMSERTEQLQAVSADAIRSGVTGFVIGIPKDSEVAPGQDRVRGGSSPAASEFAYLEELPISRELQEYTYNTCKKMGVEYELALALMWRESRFDINAVNINTNGSVDSGIMQINDINTEWLLDMGIHDLMDPKQNIDAGITIFSRFEKKYGVHNALLAYQFGETGMREKLAEGVHTTSHIQDVYSRRDYYRQQIRSA